MGKILYGVFYVILSLLLQSVFGNGSLNIALNKIATQVSTRNDNVPKFGPRNANDGKRNQDATKSECTHTTDKEPDKWWTVDFLNMYTIENVHIYARTDCCPERHSDFEIRIHNTSDWSSQYSLCYKQIGQAPTELYLNCTDFISGKYLTVYKEDNYHHYPLTLCEVEVYGTGNTFNTYISRPATLGTTIGDHITHESRPTTLETTIGDYITHESRSTTLGTTIGDHKTHESRSTTLGTTIGDYITHKSMPTTLGTTVGDYITHKSRPTTLGTTIGDYITHESRPTTLGTTIGDYITHESRPTTLADVYGTEVTGYTIDTFTSKPTPGRITTTNYKNGTTNTSKILIIQTTENMNMCLCQQSTINNNQQQKRNYSKEERKFVINEKIKILEKELKIDQSKLSSTIRKNICAEDDRRSSRHLGILGIIVLVSVTGCIVLSDLVGLIRYINKLH
ncbi:unnamed protein product [Mytilus coruscus]|uniref:Fucolectin tachylectin-4 pentraxin-1 domain-containing protein n=1 Tax=Mytilus coruscus TaxID=42192 RepID=A0A6J8DRC2_MYTCO|nr:unnamed protein product [Mytilus coruscus]